MVVAGGGRLVGPAPVAHLVVVAAQGGEILEFGLAVSRPSAGVVEVGVFGGHAAAGEDTGGFDGSYMSFHRLGCLAIEGAGGDWFAVVGDDVLPAAAALFAEDLAGDVGEDGPVSRDFGRAVAAKESLGAVPSGLADTTTLRFSMAVATSAAVSRESPSKTSSRCDITRYLRAW